MLAVSCNSRAGYKSVTADEFAEIISDTAVQLVDVRTPSEHAAGNIPGSMNIDVKSGSFAADAAAKLDKERPVAIYCRSGRRSKEAAEILVAEGFDVVELDAGYNGWNRGN